MLLLPLIVICISKKLLISLIVLKDCTDVPVVRGSWFDSAHHDSLNTKRFSILTTKTNLPKLLCALDNSIYYRWILQRGSIT